MLNLQMVRKAGKASKSLKIKNVLTNPGTCSIVIKVMKITGRKVGIHLTLARVSDPGLYLSNIADCVMSLDWWIESLYLLFLYHAMPQQQHTYGGARPLAS